MHVSTAQGPGRWNSPRRAAVYMAESLALAVLENLVHMTDKTSRAATFVWPLCSLMELA
jgi:RES domain-containing protein